MPKLTGTWNTPQVSQDTVSTQPNRLQTLGNVSTSPKRSITERHVLPPLLLLESKALAGNLLLGFPHSFGSVQ